MDLALTT